MSALAFGGRAGYGEASKDRSDRGLREPGGPRHRGAGQDEGQAAPGHADGPRELHLLRRRGRGDPLAAHAAHEQPGDRHGVAGDPGRAGVLRGDQEDAQRPPGRRGRFHRRRAGDLREHRLRELDPPLPGPRPGHHPRPPAAPDDRALPEEGPLDLAVPRGPVEPQPEAVELPAGVHREVRRGDREPGGVRPGDADAADLLHAGHRPVLAHQQVHERRGGGGEAGPLRHPHRPSAGHPDLPLRPLEGPRGGDRGVQDGQGGGGRQAGAASATSPPTTRRATRSTGRSWTRRTITSSSSPGRTAGW